MRPCHECNTPDTTKGAVITQEGVSVRICRWCASDYFDRCNANKNKDG